MALKQTDFGTGTVSRRILEISVPVTIAQFINLLYNLVDRMYLGRMEGVGTMALTGVGLCFPIITIITAFAMLFGTTGGSPLFAMERGKGNHGEAGKIMGTTFSMLLIVGIFATLLGLIFFRPVLYLFGASDNTYLYAQQYGTIYLLGSPFILTALGMNPFINAQGYGKIGMLTVVIGAVLNILLDPLFIFVFGWGVRGAAIATVFSQIVSAAFVLLFLCSQRRELPLVRKNMGVEWKRLKKIIALGFSGFIMGCTNSLVLIVCNRTVSVYGGDLYVGVMTILNSVREIFTAPLQGLTSGSVPVLAFNYGRKAFDRVRRGINFILLTSIGFTLAVWAVVFIFPQPFVRMFNSEPEMVTAASSALRIYFFGYFMMALHMTGQSAFLALGKAKQATFFSLFRKALIVAPLTILLPHVIAPAVNGVFWAEPVSNIASGILCYIVMRFTLKKEAKLYYKNSAALAENQ